MNATVLLTLSSIEPISWPSLLLSFLGPSCYISGDWFRVLAGTIFSLTCGPPCRKVHINLLKNFS